ncbi:MAG: SDR family oxidoreductase [Armatimonadota bacterium]|nr:SDR family oxidoreductase [Armatimonadota bacterium]MDR7423336.1 SDR family oxidoreductase [Armatimonadota bacterium]MDR7453113.1 SDR family oxidoreductase [Armatimonadota bacterium]MDR7456145.1 SDR family oxidoreductase [Armatimonadota bacterium]MDR7495802.1 SDR family oxidoreductase [Armatimonadota bacterium]
MEHRDRVVMITGAGGRLGSPCALAFAREGARLILTDLDASRLEAVARAARAVGARVAAIPADVRLDADVERVVAEGTAALGPIDVLVTFAGYVPTTYVVDMPTEEWDRVFDVNVKGTMLCCRTVARQMIAREAGGAIVTISSGAGTSARAGAAHYCGSKAAVNMLTQVLAIELGPYNIRVNAVAPGLVLDQVVRRGEGSPHPYVRDMLAAIPLGRTGTADEIAAAVLFLASPRASYVHGEVFYVSGGAHCGRAHMAVARGNIQTA